MISKTILVEHEIGDIVYLKADTEQLPRIVIEYIVRIHEVLYEVQNGSYKSTTHHNFEITKNKILEFLS